MKYYYIYHIPGVKFGCTANLRRRISEYPPSTRKLIELYETFVGVSDVAASRRERELNIQFGYQPGWPYNARRISTRHMKVKPQPKYCMGWGDHRLYLIKCNPQLTHQ